MPIVSFICPTNNLDVLNKHLISSLSKQNNQDYELIVVNTNLLNIKSANEALNYGASNATGRLLVFVHHDVELQDTFFIDRLLSFCDECDFGIAGVAGIVDIDGKFEVYSSVVQGPNKEQVGHANDSIKECITIDECLMIVKADAFSGFDFLRNTWHFYGVDYSLKCHNNGVKVLLFPLNIYHVSPGWSLNRDYFDTLYFVGKKYRNYRVIPTTIGLFKNGLFLGIYCFLKKLQLSLKHNKKHD